MSTPTDTPTDTTTDTRIYLDRSQCDRISSKGLVFEVERILKEPRILETAGGNMGSQVMFHGLCVVTDNGNVYFRRDDPLDD